MTINLLLIFALSLVQMGVATLETIYTAELKVLRATLCAGINRALAFLILSIIIINTSRIWLIFPYIAADMIGTAIALKWEKRNRAKKIVNRDSPYAVHSLYRNVL